MFREKLRTESSRQYSGSVDLSKIPHLKERHYYIRDIPLDGEAPKQYIKAYFYYKNCPRKCKPFSWDGYFAKSGGKSYPHESILEYIINKIGEYLGLRMNETRLAMINGQVRFLSKDFIGKGQQLVHGIEILAEYFEDETFVHEINRDRKNRREYLTFDVIERAIQYVYPKEAESILHDLVRLITYDAIVGNNDRHFYNWGVVRNIFRADRTPVYFSPVYDTARALLWNKTEEAIKRMYAQYSNGSNELDYYINRAKPRFSYEQKPEANHFELIQHLYGYNEAYKDIIHTLTAKNKQIHVINQMNRETSCFFSRKRCILMEAILTKRFTKIRETLK